MSDLIQPISFQTTDNYILPSEAEERKSVDT